uniref:FBD domain-containing protein n=1 Tax=Aegilops tauschii TaxID=37682 RepID=N1R1H9_AEGTA
MASGGVTPKIRRCNGRPGFSKEPEEGDRLSMLTDDILLSIMGRVDLSTAARTIGPLVGDAIESGLVKDLGLSILGKTDLSHCTKEDMLHRAQAIDGFFSAYPSVLSCLKRLYLHSVGFDNLDMHHVVFDCCKQLKHLTLDNCDTIASSLFKTDAPNSKLRFLEIICCGFERLELVCLPKLETLECETWTSVHAPLAFGFVPSLGELGLLDGAQHCQHEFKLSELLHGTTSIHTLTLDFQGENVWEHICDDKSRQLYAERRTPPWEMHFDGSKNWHLKELEFTGFRSLEQQFKFIRLVLERAPNLQTIILKGDERCEYYDALDTPHTSKFPKKKDEQELAIKQNKMQNRLHEKHCYYSVPVAQLPPFDLP